MSKSVDLWTDLLGDGVIQGWTVAQRYCWVAALLVAADPQPGSLVDAAGRPLRAAELARRMNVGQHTAERFIEVALAAGKLERQEDGTLTFKNWRKRQPERLAGAATKAGAATSPATSPAISESPSRARVITGPPTSKVKTARGGQGTSVRAVYDCWRAERHPGSSRYATMSPARRLKIEARLREFSPEELMTAIRAVALDPWSERPRHDDITTIFRSREQVERFLEFAERPPAANVNGNGHRGGLTAAEVLAMPETLL